MQLSADLHRGLGKRTASTAFAVRMNALCDQVSIVIVNWNDAALLGSSAWRRDFRGWVVRSNTPAITAEETHTGVSGTNAKRSKPSYCVGSLKSIPGHGDWYSPKMPANSVPTGGKEHRLTTK